MINIFFPGRHALVSLMVIFCCLLSGVKNAFSENLLIVGNSLTKHSPAPEKGWTANWGMAASSADKDFVHLLVKKLEAHTTSKIDFSIIPGHPVEKAFFNEADYKLPDGTDVTYDYIVLEIGDNIDFTHPLKDTFQHRYRELIDKLKIKLGKNGVLVCLGKWWSNDFIDNQIRSACETGKGKFVSLKPISLRIESKASHERQFTDEGVGNHPGDWAMREISEAVFCALSECKSTGIHGARQVDIGMFYFPGWHSQSKYWKDLKGLPDSRSPNVPWPEREPLLGYYSEEDIKIAEQHIEWASQYDITFFAYDWYWDGKSTFLNHAIDNYIKASNNSKLKFSLLWANHSDVPRNLQEFDDMVTYWLKHYLAHPQYYRINEKPVIFVFSRDQLETVAKKFGWSANTLIKRADGLARSSGFPGIYFVATTDTRPSDDLEAHLTEQGFSAYTGWCNVGAQSKRDAVDYQVMVDAYLDSYDAAAKTKGNLLYIPPVSPGRDSRPWLGRNAQVRTDATPIKFRSMLQGAKALIDSHKNGVIPLVMIQSWNEWGEGAYIEPSKKWGFGYLNEIQNILGKCGLQIGKLCSPTTLK
jgi:hypothetical protein